MSWITRARESSALFLGVVIATIIGGCATSEPLSGPEVESLPGQTKFLVLDSRIIDEATGARLTLGEVTKHPANPLFGEDKSWEPRMDNVYPNVIFDKEDNLYKCWYSPFVVFKAHTLIPRESRKYMDLIKTEEAIEGRQREMGVCYATSEDGIHWEKPELGLVEFGGNTNNNILLRGPHGAGVFKDYRESDPARQYKMFYIDRRIDSEDAYYNAVSFSSDGVHWSEPVSCPEIDAADGTNLNAFWAPGLKRYVGMTRANDKEKDNYDRRVLGRTESSDFVNWTKSRVVLRGLEPHLEIHDMMAFAYCGIYLGLVGLYNSDPDVDRQHLELAWSTDTVEWRRINPGAPLISNSEERGSYDWGVMFASAPVFLEDEIRLYYGSGNDKFFGWRDGFLSLATLRPDGFAGYEPTSTETPALITTKSLLCRGETLSITADVWDGGSVHVELLDEDRNQLANSKSISNTVTDGQVTWIDDWDLADMSGKRVRLNFEINNAKLYSFQIQ